MGAVSRKFIVPKTSQTPMKRHIWPFMFAASCYKAWVSASFVVVRKWRKQGGTKAGLRERVLLLTTHRNFYSFQCLKFGVGHDDDR